MKKGTPLMRHRYHQSDHDQIPVRLFIHDAAAHGIDLKNPFSDGRHQEQKLDI
jgi:hypothetical protein